MIRNIFARIGRFHGCGVPAVFALLLTAQCVEAQKFAPLFKPNWGTLNSSGNPKPIAPEGFGDRQNSWAWSMAWFNGKLLVGTARSEQCITAYSEHLASAGYAYPPSDPAISCPANVTQLALQAEIWSYDPVAKTWTRVFQSPLTVPVPGQPGLMEPPDVGFRDMFIYEEPSGTEALYVSGCSADAVFPGVGGGRLLRSIDGVNFAPVPQDQAPTWEI